MKKFILIFISVLLTAATFAQNVVPQMVNFSATVRDDDNNLMNNADLTVRIAINRDGDEIYWEEHQVTTNANGFVSFRLNVDQLSSSEACSFEKIQWQEGTYTMNVQYKRTSDVEYKELGTHDITSVFYAFVSNYAFRAQTAQNLEGFAIDVEGARDGDVLVYNSVTGMWEARDILSLLQANAGLTTYTIKFYANGGTGIIRPQTMVADSAQAITANTFTRTGYEFAGWNTAAEGDGDSYTDGQSITPTGDLILYAQWRQVLTVTFDPNGGNGEMAPQIFSAGEEQALTANAFTREGFTFGGWSASATGVVVYADQRTITISESITLYARWIAPINGHIYVDLGLPNGTLWADCNVGANSPEKYGNYYAWGETKTKSSYTEKNYNYTNNPPILPLDVDAAAVNWGSGWRMPTWEEFDELKNNCTWEWTTWTPESNVYGYRVTSNENGNSIFLPAAGARPSGSLSADGSYGHYWSSTLRSSDRTDAWVRYFNSSICNGNTYGPRYMGRSVRPVCVSQN